MAYANKKKKIFIFREAIYRKTLLQQTSEVPAPQPLLSTELTILLNTPALQLLQLLGGEVPPSP